MFRSDDTLDRTGSRTGGRTPVSDVIDISERDEELIRCLEAAADNNFSVRPKGDDPLSRAVSKLIAERAKSATKALDNVVSQTVNANEAAIASGYILNAAREADHRAQSMAAAIEQMSVGVKQIGHSSAGAVDDVKNVEAATESGRNAVKDASQAMDRISEIVTKAASRGDALSQASEQIGEIVSSIEDIASQTNLLALNATIEAARAGEAGKGFAVVAAEVKNLSQQTASATEDIRQRIEHLQGEIADIITSMHSGAEAVKSGLDVMDSVGGEMNEIDGKVQHVRSGMTEIAEILRQQTEASVEVAEGVMTVAQLTASTVEQIERTSDVADKAVSRIGRQLAKLSEYELPGKGLRLAKADHVIWKKRLADMLVGRAKLRDDELTDHRSSRFGQWYYGEGSEDFGQHPKFTAIESAHIAVHEHARESASLYQDGDLAGALAEVGKVETASQELMRLLDELQAPNAESG